jgi:polyhydroxybutyrate depolymerase
MTSTTIAVLVLLIFIAVSTFFLLNKTNGQIKSSGQIRKYRLYVPELYDSSAPTPLVICLHGLIQWPAHQQKLSGWNALADEHGFIVVYPRGTGFPLRWNTRPLDDNPGAIAAEVQFFSDLIDHLSRNYSIDQTRIYANGMSNGGGMSHLLACELFGRIAAIGGVAGAYLYPWDDCRPGRPVPVIAFHGTQDPIVPYHGGPAPRSRSYKFDPVEVWAAKWASRNGCDEKREIIPSIGNVHCVRYTNSDEDAEVILYSIEGGGHSWPGGHELPKWIVGHTSQEINATELMWAFFCKYALDRRLK